tara:strand:- start:468 stop:836 length:369 start_codon:yes stop_codon:yes gene_type:complete
MSYFKPISTLLTAAVLSISGTALASSYHVFADAAGGKALSSGKLEAAGKHFKGSLDFADHNNLCVLHALNGAMTDAMTSCAIALDLAKSESLSVRRRALPGIEANLDTLQEAISNSIAASDD